MAVRRDDWLSEVLGYPVFAVEGAADDLPGGRRALYYARVDASDVATLAALLQVGFVVVDVNVTFERAAMPAAADGANIDVVRAGPEHAEDLLAIAGSCFRYSRFHLDPQIPQTLADTIKREWVRSYIDRRRGTELLAATVAGRSLGFLAVLETDDASVIDLVGVATDAQGTGVGSALVSAFIERHRSAGKPLRVGTQVANVPSLRLYERLGFRVERAAYVVHLHTRG